MILIDDGNTELGAALKATMPEGTTVQTKAYEYAISAYPSVIVDVPAYAQDVPAYDANGSFTGMTTQTIPAHQEVLRMPVSWEAVGQYVAYVAARAAQSPAE